MAGKPHRRKKPGTRADERPQRQKGARPSPQAGAPTIVPPVPESIARGPFGARIEAHREAIAEQGIASGTSLDRYWRLLADWFATDARLAHAQAFYREHRGRWTVAARDAHEAREARQRRERDRIERQLAAFETEHGLTPLAQFRMGITPTAKQRPSLNDGAPPFLSQAIVERDPPFGHPRKAGADA